ncbi:GNAT family N-acetyltransferase [Naumannella halotolerans]|uniref:Uncharacterized protein n=1 Tax=Naumannella halotolerans TaxID=993414 RepID=A0A4R7J6M7_9ACTN|nr:GNAT family N-acetyltransferase [Naumannella halotolerans]TDT33051.1 hypothetical protein CLV29_0647 [Naumannella halotolerans]
MDTQITVADNPARRRYEIHAGDDLLGFAAYELGDGLITFTHTEVDPSLGGRGVGSTLARHALDDARDRGLKVQPLCPFIRGWIDRHPDYASLVAEPATE